MMADHEPDSGFNLPAGLMDAPDMSGIEPECGRTCSTCDHWWPVGDRLGLCDVEAECVADGCSHPWKLAKRLSENATSGTDACEGWEEAE